MKYRVLVSVVCGCVILLAPALRSQESQPSLGDAARKERERKSSQPSAGTQEKKAGASEEMKASQKSAPSITREAHFEALETDVDRPGLDYRSFDLSESRPELCQTECGSDARCRSFTYVKPGVQGPKARCWLKYGIPSPAPNQCCISAVKVPGFSPLEYDNDRPGQDYREFDLSEARAEACQDECARDGACKAFTYVRPGYGSATARCRLKAGVPDSKVDLCCVSGVKGSETVKPATPDQKSAPASAPKPRVRHSGSRSKKPGPTL